MSDLTELAALLEEQLERPTEGPLPEGAPLSALSEDAPEVRWASGLARYGKPVLVWAAVALARVHLSELELVPNERVFMKGLWAAEDWCVDPSPENADEAARVSQAAQEALLERLLDGQADVREVAIGVSWAAGASRVVPPAWAYRSCWLDAAREDPVAARVRARG